MSESVLERRRQRVRKRKKQRRNNEGKERVFSTEGGASPFGIAAPLEVLTDLYGEIHTYSRATQARYADAVCRRMIAEK